MVTLQGEVETSDASKKRVATSQADHTFHEITGCFIGSFSWFMKSSPHHRVVFHPLHTSRVSDMAQMAWMYRTSSTMKKTEFGWVWGFDHYETYINIPGSSRYAKFLPKLVGFLLVKTLFFFLLTVPHSRHWPSNRKPGDEISQVEMTRKTWRFLS